MTNEFYEKVINHLELLMKQFDLNHNIFVFKNKDNEFVGFELTEDEEPTTAKSTDTVEYGTIIELYSFSKKKLGFKDNQIMLKALRLSNDLTVQNVADLISKTRQEVSRWENTYEPPIKIIETLISNLNKEKQH